MIDFKTCYESRDIYLAAVCVYGLFALIVFTNEPDLAGKAHGTTHCVRSKSTDLLEYKSI